MDPEKFLIPFLHEHVNIAIPIAIMALRLIVLRLAGDIKELFRTLFSVPMDLVFVSISLILAGLARVIPGFASRFRSPTDADLAGTVFVLALVGLGVFWSYVDRFNRTLAESFYVCFQQIRRLADQPEFKRKDAGFPASGRVLFALVYLIALVMSFGFELVLSIVALTFVLQRMR